MRLNSDSKIYFPNLDSLRFFAALTVVISHCVIDFDYKFSNRFSQIFHLHFFKNGNLGVTFFFVLSGFLISWLLLKEKEKTKTIRLSSFYMRRVLRIWPVYYIVIIVGFWIGVNCYFPILNNSSFAYRVDISQLNWYVFFLANYDPGEKSQLVSSLWSVAVEEQFYLLWPLVLFLIDRKYFAFFCLIIISISFCWRIYDIQRGGGFVSTPFVMSDLAYGGLICYYSIYSSMFMSFIKNISKCAIYIVYLLLIGYVFLHGFSHIFGERIYLYYAPFEPLIFSTFFGFIILEQNFAKNSFFKFGRIKLTNKLGKISYGIYAYHCFAILITFYLADLMGLNTNSFCHYLIKIILVLFITVIISYLSYQFIEKKFLRLKEKFSSN